MVPLLCAGGGGLPSGSQPQCAGGSAAPRCVAPSSPWAWAQQSSREHALEAWGRGGHRTSAAACARPPGMAQGAEAADAAIGAEANLSRAQAEDVIVGDLRRPSDEAAGSEMRRPSTATGDERRPSTATGDERRVSTSTGEERTPSKSTEPSKSHLRRSRSIISASSASTSNAGALLADDVVELIDNGVAQTLTTTNLSDIDIIVKTLTVKAGTKRDSRWSESGISNCDSVPDHETSKEVAAIIRQVIGKLFDGSDEVPFQPEQHHIRLYHLLKKIFYTSHRVQTQTTSEEIGLFDATPAPMRWGSEITNHKRCSSIQKGINVMVSHMSFIIFYLLLTMYLLFVPDIIALSCEDGLGDTFLWINTVVFLSFVGELMLLLVAKRRYWATLPFFLDVVSLFSILSITWFMKSINFLSDDQAYVAKLARSSRTTRLARLARVARITRFIPSLMRLCRRRQTRLARDIVLRRLWRCFLFLDQDQDGLISSCDFKYFYLAMLQECSFMMGSHQKLDIVNMDLPSINEEMVELDDKLSYTDFCSLFLSTILGKQVARYHVHDLHHDESVWALTQSLSDNSSLKVCVGILLLLAMMQFLEIDVQDTSLHVGLAQLEVMAQREAQGSLSNSTNLCDHVAMYAEDRKLLYLYLDGRTVWDRGECLSPAIPSWRLDPFDFIDDMIREDSLQDASLTRTCIPQSVAECERGHNITITSLSVVDMTQQECDDNIPAIATTAIVILLLLFFVHILNMGLDNFSKSLLQPLRALVDDMMAMTSLELVNIHQDMPFEEKNVTAEELENLNVAFKFMRNAICSWSKYVPPSVVEKLFSAGIEAEIGVSRQSASILFCDVDGFEEICHDLTPTEVLSLLSNVLGRVSDVIQHNGGTLLEFIGDEVLAVFNTPNPVTNHVFAAALSALEIHAVIGSMPMLRAVCGKGYTIRCRCGVHYAEIFAGNIGSPQRMKYGLLGDGINLTARLKGLNARYRPASRTLASDTTLNDEVCKRRLLYRPVDLVAMKGKVEPTTVYEIHLRRSADVKVKRAIPKHVEAFRLYQDRDFTAARASFESVTEMLEADGEHDETSRLLARRCAKYIEEPPPPDWDGVDRLKQKTFAAVEESKAGAETKSPKMMVPAAVSAILDDTLQPQEAPEADGQENGASKASTTADVSKAVESSKLSSDPPPIPSWMGSGTQPQARPMQSRFMPDNVALGQDPCEVSKSQKEEEGSDTHSYPGESGTRPALGCGWLCAEDKLARVPRTGSVPKPFCTSCKAVD